MYQKEAVQRVAGLVDTFVHNFREGIEVITDYSGMDFPREALHQLQTCFSSELEPATRRTRGQLIKHKRACDTSKLCQGILKGYSHDLDGRESCVFKDTQERLPEEMQRRVKLMRGPEIQKKGEQTADQKMETATRNRTIAYHLLDHMHEPTRPASVWCTTSLAQPGTHTTPSTATACE